MQGYAERSDGTLSDLISKNKTFSESYKKRSISTNVIAVNNSSKCFFCKALMNENDRGVCSKYGYWDSKSCERYVDDFPF